MDLRAVFRPEAAGPAYRTLTGRDGPHSGTIFILKPRVLTEENCDYYLAIIIAQLDLFLLRGRRGKISIISLLESFFGGIILGWRTRLLFTVSLPKVATRSRF